MGFYSPNLVQVPVESFSYSNQSEAGEDGSRYSLWNRAARQGDFTTTTSPDCRTMYEAFRAGAGLTGSGDCLGWRQSPTSPYQWLSYNEVIARAQNFGSGLLSMGLRPGEHTMVGIYSRNCPEWVIAEHGLHTFSMVSVPLYDSLGPDCRAWVIRETEMRVVVAQDEAAVRAVLASSPPCLKLIVTVRDARPAAVEEADSLGVKVVRFEDVEQLGAAEESGPVPPRPDSLATVCFSRLATAGPALLGRPKGVMLSHANFIAAASACLLQLGQYAPSREDTLFSFLPLAFTLQRCAELTVFMTGGRVGFYSGNMRCVAADLKALQPTILPAVPKFMNRLYDSCVATAARSNLFRWLFNLALAAKTEELYKGMVRRDSVWDRLVFWWVRARLGGRVRLVVTGSAPLKGNVITFMRAALGCLIVEGYGQTECVAPCTLTAPGDPQPDQVGPPLPCNNVKLVDVPDMEYFAVQGQGEVCVRGANVMLGYYRDPEMTAAAVDREGWLHTGDVGEWTPSGTLRIIDHKKPNFKLSNGEYVAPEEVELVYTRSRYIAQVFVHGDSLKSCVVGVVVPRQAAVQEWAERRNIPSHSFTALCSNRELKRFIQSELTALGREEGLNFYEEPKEIYLHPNLFSVQTGLLSSSGRLKRQTLMKYFKPQLEDMYLNLD